MTLASNRFDLSFDIISDIAVTILNSTDPLGAMRFILSCANVLLCTLGLYGFDFLLICRLLLQVGFIRATTLIMLLIPRRLTLLIL